jgi:chemotaxis receptor (MCP) glutamine deamidase CheD
MPEELQRQLADEEKRTTLRDRAPAGPDIPCPPSAAPVLESGTRYAPAQAAGILAHESCPKTATEREAWLAKQIETSPERRGIPVLYESPYLRIEWQGSALSVFSRDAAPGSSPRTSYAAATLLKERWLAGGEAPTTHEPTPLPMTLQDRGDCVISQLAASGFLIPRDPTSDEAALAARLAETQGVERNTDRTQPQVISPTDARKLEDLEFAGMFQIKSSSPGKPLVGTWGLGPCVGVSLWNSRTKTASVVHLDPTQSVPDTLQEMLDSMGGRSSGIEARIIGGWTGFSERTLLHARSFMQERGIAIIQEDTLGFETAKGSRGFIVDSRTGRLFARVSASP